MTEGLQRLVMIRPNSYDRIITSRFKPPVIRAEADYSNYFIRGRSLPGCQIVHVRFEVFDDTVFVCRYEISTRMSKLHSTYRMIVRLENGLEIEGKAIPQSEFAAC